MKLQDHNVIKLPSPHFHQSHSVTIAGNDDGDLVRSICLFGGCRSPFVSKPIRFDDGVEVSQYSCQDLSDSNMVLAPETDGYVIEEKAPMPRPRYRHSSVAINGKIWIVGGRDENDTIVNNFDIYDELYNKWSIINDGLDSIKIPGRTDYTYGISDHCSFAFGDLLFIVGGFDQNYESLKYVIAIQTTESIEQNRLVYSIRSPMNVPRGSCGVTTVGEFAFVAGGFTNEDGYCEAMQSSEVYDPKRDQWNLLSAPLKYGRARPSLLYLDHKIFIFGGEKRGKFDSSSGKCKGEERFRRIEQNKMLPNRLTFPVESAEVMMVEDNEFSLSSWRVLEKKIGNKRYMYSAATVPSESSIYFFGGVISHISKEALQSSSCPGCFVVSDRISMYDTTEEDLGLGPTEILIVTACTVSFIMIVLLGWKNRRKRMKRDEEELHQEIRHTGSDDLVGGQLNWRGRSVII